jgi:uncharacterized protein (DUF885 family)
MSLDKKNIMDRYIKEYILLNPSYNDFIGLPEYKHLRKHWENNLTDEYGEAHVKLNEKYLSDMKKKKDLSIWEKSFIYDLEMNLKLNDSPMIYMPINHMDNGILYFIELALGDSTYKFKTKEDYDFFINKTNEFDIWCRTAIQKMKEGIQQKYVLPRVSIIKMIFQLKNALKTKDYKDHKIKVKLDYDFIDILDNKITNIINYMLIFLENIYIKHSTTSIGFSDYPSGKKYYKLFVESETTDNLTIKQIYDLGFKEVKRIHNEVLDIKEKLNFKGTHDEFNDFINSKKDLKFKDKKDMDATYKFYKKYISKNVMSLFPDKLNQKSLIKPVPSYMENGSPAAYYMPGDVVGKRNGVFYYNSQNPSETNKYEAESLSLHEDSPGHHYQITLTNLNPKIPLFIKLLDNNAYIEGWGLYCENLGVYENVYNKLGKLNMEMLRAIRLVIDTGIHYYDWSYEECVSYFKQYSNSPEHEIESEIQRYIVDPGQALSYKIGEITLLKLRQLYYDNGFTIQEFHHDVLIDGPIPLSILIDKLETKVKNKKMMKKITNKK